MSTRWLWVRRGDQDDYHRFESIQQASSYIREANIRRVERHNDMGVQAPDWSGQNYISVFWGDGRSPSIPGKVFQDTEIEYLNAYLN